MRLQDRHPAILWQNAYYFNAHRVEYALQHWLKEELGLELGQHLHREFFGQRNVKVFMTSSPQLPELLQKGQLKINP